MIEQLIECCYLLLGVEENVLAALLDGRVSKDTNGRANGNTLANLSDRDVACELLSRAGEQDLEHEG
jgi:hypothetical protein